MPEKNRFMAALVPQGGFFSSEVANSLRGEGFDASEDGIGRGTPLVPAAYPIQEVGVAVAIQEDNQNGVTIRDTAGSLRSDAPGTQPCGTLIFDTTQITSDKNFSNPKPGDPCHPLASGAHAPAVAFQCHGSNVGEMGTMRAGNGNETGGVPFVATAFQERGRADGRSIESVKHIDSYGLKGYNNANYGKTNQTDTGKVLLAVRDKVGEEAFTEWGLGILDSLQSQKILRCEVHGEKLRCPSSESGFQLGDSALSRTKDMPTGAVCEVRQAGRERRGPQGWKLPKQLAGKLASHVSRLSQPETQIEGFLHDLRGASEGLWVLCDALSAIQENWRSAQGADSRTPEMPGLRRAGAQQEIVREALHAGEAEKPVMAVRRLLPIECERLQGFPDNYTSVPFNGKPASDGPRYRAIGNSMAVPVLEWIGRRIMQAHNPRSFPPTR